MNKIKTTIQLIKVILSLRSKGLINYTKNVLQSLCGRYERVCPICNYSGYFLPFGSPPRYDARCPSCKSRERHRLFFLMNQELGYIKSNDSVLHFAPEPEISEYLKGITLYYSNSDLKEDIKGIKIDIVSSIESIELEDESFDRIICSHVLEHVDDIKALAELHRVLKQNGILFLMVPIKEGLDHTFERPVVNNDSEDAIYNELFYGQKDHLRVYGKDFRNRLNEAGFVIEEYTAKGENAVRYSLLLGEKVFICRKKIWARE